MSAKDTSLISDNEEQRPTNRVWRRLLTALIVGIMASQSAGCCFTGGCGGGKLGSQLMERQISCYRDKVWAKRAFNLRYGNCDRKFGDHFRNGFVEGYCGVCDGGDGYVPAMPPECYWGNEFQCAEGAQCVNSWFEGYPAGAVAARKDGAGSFHDIYISKMINSAIVQDNREIKTPRMAPVVARDKTNVPPLVPQARSRTLSTPDYHSPPTAESKPPVSLPMPMATTKKTLTQPAVQMPQMPMPMPMNGVQPASYENYVDGN